MSRHVHATSKRFLKKLLAISVFAGVLQLLHAFNVGNAFLPAPFEVLTAFSKLLISGEIFPDILSSVTRVCVGFILAGILGSLLGLLLAWQPRVGEYFTPILELLRPIPPIAWVPLAILIFGLGNSAAYFIVFIGTFFPVFTNTYFGARSMPDVLRNTCESYEITGFTYFYKVLFFYSLPHIFTGLRVGMGMAWMSVIASELVGIQGGLGYFIQFNRLLLNIANVVAGMLYIGIIGLCFGALLRIIERWATPWHHEKR